MITYFMQLNVKLLFVLILFGFIMGHTRVQHIFLFPDGIPYIQQQQPQSQSRYLPDPFALDNPDLLYLSHHL